MSDLTLNVSDSRVAAFYATYDKVMAAKAVLTRKLGLSDSKIRIIAPDDNDASRKLEGRSEKVGSNMFHLHYLYGSLGVVIGMIAAYLLVTFGPAWAQQSPAFTYIALISPGLFIGLFLAGFMSLKPERDVVNQEVVEKQDQRQWTLVVDTENTKFDRDDIVEEIRNTSVLDIQK